MTDQILIHHGVKGMKWGVRRYQNTDGTLTSAGKSRYRTGSMDSDGWTPKTRHLPGMPKDSNSRTNTPCVPGAIVANAGSHATKDKKEEYKQASKDRRELSDEELMERIGRLEMEKKLRDLTRDNLDERTPGQKATQEVLANSGKRVATVVLVGGTLYLGKAILTGEFDPTEMAKYVFPNPNAKKK